jgi:hypothetical protein
LPEHTKRYISSPLDGVIQAGADKDGDFSYGDWSRPYRSPAGLAIALAEWGECFDLLLGCRTYDIWSDNPDFKTFTRK